MKENVKKKKEIPSLGDFIALSRGGELNLGLVELLKEFKLKFGDERLGEEGGLRDGETIEFFS